MNVLVACEESQTVCKAFRGRGHNAFSCDVQECSGGHPEWHIKCDVLKVLNPKVGRSYRIEYIEFKTQDESEHRIAGKWDLIVAHPPCTYFSTAGANWLFRGGVLNEYRYAKGLQMKDLFMKIYNADCEKICIENPVPMKIWELPKHSQEIQPWQFGHPYTKKTRLWLKGLPFLEPTEVVEPVAKWVSCGNKTNRKSKIRLFVSRTTMGRKELRHFLELLKLCRNSGEELIMKDKRKTIKIVKDFCVKNKVSFEILIRAFIFWNELEPKEREQAFDGYENGEFKGCGWY